MDNRKKRNQTLLVIGAIVAFFVIVALVIVVKINNWKKAQNRKQQTAIVEPNINAEQERKGFKNLHDKSVMDIFNGDSVPDSIPGDTISSDVLDISAKLDTLKDNGPVKARKVVKKPVVNALATTIAEEEAKKQKPAPRPAYRPAPKAKTHRDNVAFNFVVVKKDEPAPIAKSEVEEETDDVNLNSLSEGRIYGTYTLRHNEPVKMRSVEKVRLSNKKYIPEGALLFGVCSFRNSRFHIRITRAMTPKGDFPVDLCVYDSYDFQEGLFIKGADIDLKPEDTASDVMEEVGDVMPNQMIGSSVKGMSKLVSKDVKKIKKITLKVEDNYSIWLLDNTQKPKK